jgi:hypothetical protein
MTRLALLLSSLVLALGALAGGAGAASLKPLPALNGVRCHLVVDSSGLYGYSCGRAGDLRSYVVTIEIASRNPYGPRPGDVRSGSFVRATRIGCSGHAYVMVVATRTDGDAKLARIEASTLARHLARLNAAQSL